MREACGMLAVTIDGRVGSAIWSSAELMYVLTQFHYGIFRVCASIHPLYINKYEDTSGKSSHR